MSDDLARAILLSLRVAILATLLTCATAIPLAFVLARRRVPGRSLIETLLTVPLVLPPTVVGYALIATLGAQSPIGRWMREHLGYTILFRIEGAVLAATIVSFPLLFLPAKAAFASVERELEDVALLMGASRLAIFWHVSLPLARRGIFSGVLLAFARSLGEFGATVMVLGVSEDRMTLPISIYLSTSEIGVLGRAWPAVLLLTATSLVVILLYNRTPLGRED
jgi:molybdate transport system permease protein